MLAVRKQNHRRHDRLQGVDSREKAFAGEAQVHRDLIRNVREVAALARRAGDPMQHNTAMAQCATAYFMLTGLHGVHVAIGIGVLAWILWRNNNGEFSKDYWTPVDLAALYWHLVDLIWIYLFPLLYLI